ncbi:YihY/virulence factor BrkB family protein [Agromyces larvae]|uniref:YihY/virulence factor BrkB family protein n=1 Tax=Agromyces larvae TaxID=2929802 RepID=A0ABY4C0A7_9MICO|nr:YihY/virulence factor BrkB family protein [Agromyces larvae]UOE44444.1 YihY/virulence factor BrkB family protein [Agromyces larvae]
MSDGRRSNGRRGAPAPDSPAGGVDRVRPAGEASEPVDDRPDLRDRIEDLRQPLRERFDPQIRTVTTITKKTLALFPVRVWRHFLAQNGFILSAGMSYQSLFAVFAGIYVVFAVAGIWLTGSAPAMTAFVTLVNTYAPGLIGDENAVISQSALEQIAQSSSGVLGWTGVIALAGFIWTAIGFVTYARIGVRSMFGLPKDSRSYLLLKARDLVAAMAFGLVLLLASAMSIVTVNFIDWTLDLLGWDFASRWSTYFLQGGALLVVFTIDTLAIAALFRFLSGAAMPWRRMWAGSLLGSAGLSLLQLFSSVVLAFTTANPLLATFAVFIGLLLWFRVTSIVILVAASWVAVEAADAHESLRLVTPAQLAAERAARERAALITAAEVRVREARDEFEATGWLGRIPARHRLERAEAELERVRASGTDGADGEEAPAGRRDVRGLP